VLRPALKDSLPVALFFASVVLVNGLLAVVLIEFLQAIGSWGPPAASADGAVQALSEVWASRRLR
jgi:hypothetical protein